MKRTHLQAHVNRCLPLPIRPRRGVVLIMTLAAVVLITSLILVFFSRAQLNRQIAFSSTNQITTRILADSALGLIVGELRQQIVDGSEAPDSVNRLTQGGITLFRPKDATHMLPERAGVDNPAAAPSLVAVSALNKGLYDGGTLKGSSVSIAAPSLNRRALSASTWFDAESGGPGIATQSTLPTWVFLTQGNGPTASPNLGAQPTSGDFVIGRFAYTVYNVSGLLDANAAGYPAVAAANSATKSSQAYADLDSVPLLGADADKLATWRNSANTTSAQDYEDYLLDYALPTGFLLAKASNRAFLSRRDLIRFAQDGPGGLTVNSLPYFTSSSIAANAPSWGPQHNASTWGGSNDGVDTTTANLGTPLPGIYAYADLADSVNALNRFLPNVRVQTAFTRPDGTQAQVGEPLIKHRFDLSRLTWISHNSTALPAGITAADVYDSFGLTSNLADGSWSYNHGAPGNGFRIMTLEEVAQAGREPDFFELLQAAILHGSLGLCDGNPNNTGSDPETGGAGGGEFFRAANPGAKNRTATVRIDANYDVVHAQPKYQILQIGANLITQSATDGFPRDFSLNGEHFYGAANLPYIQAVADTALRPSPSAGTGLPFTQWQAYVHRWMCFALWNPLQNAQAPISGAPAKIRVYIESGDVDPYVHDLPWRQNPFAFNRNQGESWTPASPGWISLNVADYAGRFSEPTQIDYNLSSTTDGDGGTQTTNQRLYGRVRSNFGSWSRAGIYMGWSYSPDTPDKVSQCTPLDPAETPKEIPGTPPTPASWERAAKMDFSKPPTIQLQYWDADARTWRTYQQLRSLDHTRDGRGDPYMEPADPEWNSTWWSSDGHTINHHGPLAATNNEDAWNKMAVDPRTPRTNLRAPITRKTASNFLGTRVDQPKPKGPHFQPIDGSFLSNWADNHSTSLPAYYTDRDGVQRVGDGAGWAGADPQVLGNLSGRPLFLHRPFANVGELGLVSRDDPWKTLNFMSTNSADDALLDVFYVGGVSSSTGIAPKVEPPARVGGKVNLNAAPAPVLQALLTGTARSFTPTSPVDVDTTLDSGVSQTLAEAVVTQVQDTPLVTLGDLAAVLPQPQLGEIATSNTHPGNKIQREALIRALANNGDVRTWNLLIDVVAQTGRYPHKTSTATSPDQFIVEGEKRYWLHVAIDRFTGRIIHQQLEPVL